MRRLLYISVILFCSSALYGQALYDSIDFKKIHVNGIPLGSKKEEVLKKFGEPHKVVTTEGVKGRDMYADFHYNKSTLRISPAAVFNGFKITESDLVLQYGQFFSIKTGDPIQQFEQEFPLSFKSYQKDTGGKFKLKIKAGNSYIVFKTKDGLIDEMEIKENIPQL